MLGASCLPAPASRLCPVRSPHPCAEGSVTLNLGGRESENRGAPGSTERRGGPVFSHARPGPGGKRGAEIGGPVAPAPWRARSRIHPCRAWLGATPGPRSARGSLRRTPQGLLSPAEAASCRGPAPESRELLSSRPGSGRPGDFELSARLERASALGASDSPYPPAPRWPPGPRAPAPAPRRPPAPPLARRALGWYVPARPGGSARAGLP